MDFFILKELEERIEHARRQLHGLIDKSEVLTMNEIVNKSQELDILLSEYSLLKVKLPLMK